MQFAGNCVIFKVAGSRSRHLKMKGAVSMYDRKAFKQEAKQLMKASTPHFMLVALVYVLLTTGLNYVVSWLTGGGPLAGILSVFLNILVWLFSIVMAVGFANYALRLARREPTGMGSLFAAFSFSGRALGVQLLTALFIFLWGLLAVVVLAIVLALLAALVNSVPLVVIAAVVLYIAVVVVLVSIVLRYAMASFALVDDPDAGVMEAIRRSVRMMRGYKGKLFVLDLSFIGWDLLVALIAGIVTGIGLAVSGTDWVFSMGVEMWSGYDPFAIYDVIEEFTSQMFLWTLLAEVLSLPLSLWLMVYRQTATARFYNYVGGYDYHQYMNAQQTPPVQEPQQPPQPPAGGYYTPQPSTPEEPESAARPEQPQEPEQPETPPAQDSYYTSVLPPETSDEGSETPDEADDDTEEI